MPVFWLSLGSVHAICLISHERRYDHIIYSGPCTLSGFPLRANLPHQGHEDSTNSSVNSIIGRGLWFFPLTSTLSVAACKRLEPTFMTRPVINLCWGVVVRLDASATPCRPASFTRQASGQVTTQLRKSLCSEQAMPGHGMQVDAKPGLDAPIWAA